MPDTPKNDHWQEVVLTPTGVAPGTYGPATITIGEDGRITNASNTSITMVRVVSTIAQLPTIPAPTNGTLAIVLNDGSGNEQLYTWNNTNADLGAPLNRWRLLSTTEAQTLRLDFRQSAIGLGSNQTIGAVLPDSAIVKRISVEIVTPYSVGTTIEITDNAMSHIYVPFSSINTQLAGIYSVDLSTNLDDVLTLSGPSQGQIRAIVGGGPVVGSGVVYLEYADP